MSGRSWGRGDVVGSIRGGARRPTRDVAPGRLVLLAGPAAPGTGPGPRLRAQLRHGLGAGARHEVGLPGPGDQPASGGAVRRRGGGARLGRPRDGAAEGRPARLSRGGWSGSGPAGSRPLAGRQAGRDQLLPVESARGREAPDRALAGAHRLGLPAVGAAPDAALAAGRRAPRRVARRPGARIAQRQCGGRDRRWPCSPARSGSPARRWAVAVGWPRRRTRPGWWRACSTPARPPPRRTGRRRSPCRPKGEYRPRWQRCPSAASGTATPMPVGEQGAALAFGNASACGSIRTARVRNLSARQAKSRSTRSMSMPNAQRSSVACVSSIRQVPAKLGMRCTAYGLPISTPREGSAGSTTIRISGSLMVICPVLLGGDPRTGRQERRGMDRFPAWRRYSRELGARRSPTSWTAGGDAYRRRWQGGEAARMMAARKE